MEETKKQQSRLEGPGGVPLGKVIGAVITVGIWWVSGLELEPLWATT